MKIIATITQPEHVEIEIKDTATIEEIRDAIFAEARGVIFDEPQITSCLKVNELCPEENEEITEVLG